MADFKEVKDSGKRQNFNTGSVRDTDEGKGQPHLIAGEPLAKLYEYLPATEMQNFSLGDAIQLVLLQYSQVVEKREQNLSMVYKAIKLAIQWIAEEQNNEYSYAMRQLAQHYQNGAKKYSKNNWRKGQPVSRYYDSAMRHLWAAMDKKLDENHKAALLWNLIGIVQTKIDVERGILVLELNDYPFIVEEIK
jgi:hypothetical protein